MRYIHVANEENPSDRLDATEQTTQISNNPCGLDLQSVYLKMMRDTLLTYGLYLYQVRNESVKLTVSYGANTTKVSNSLCELALWFFTWKTHMPHAFYKINVWCKFHGDPTTGACRRANRPTNSHTKLSLMYRANDRNYKNCCWYSRSLQTN